MMAKVTWKTSETMMVIQNLWGVITEKGATKGYVLVYVSTEDGKRLVEECEWAS